jgi:hypothetical protein
MPTNSIAKSHSYRAWERNGLADNTQGTGMFKDPDGNNFYVWLPRSLHQQVEDDKNVPDGPVRAQCIWPSHQNTSFEFIPNADMYAICPLPPTQMSQDLQRCVVLCIPDCLTCNNVTRCEPHIIDNKLPHDKTQVSAGICSINHNDVALVQEWTTWHKMIGFDKIFLYDHNSTERMSLMLELRTHVMSGFLTWVLWPDADIKWGWQFFAIFDCLSRFRHHAQYIAVIDIDEFFVVPAGVKEYSISSWIAHMFQQASKITHSDVWNLHIPWYVFACIDAFENSTQLVSERCTTRAATHEVQAQNAHSPYYLQRQYDNRTVMASKSIVLTEKFIPSPLVHSHYFARLSNSFSVPKEWLRIHHYHIRSKEQMLRSRNVHSDNDVKHQFCVIDVTMLPFAPLIRKQMAVDRLLFIDV